MKRCAAVILGLATCLGSAHAYTKAEETYCWPEVKRLCTVGQIAEAALGNYDGVKACFASHHRDISRACLDAIHKANGK